MMTLDSPLKLMLYEIVYVQQERNVAYLWALNEFPDVSFLFHSSVQDLYSFSQ